MNVGQGLGVALKGGCGMAMRKSIWGMPPSAQGSVMELAVSLRRPGSDSRQDIPEAFIPIMYQDGVNLGEAYYSGVLMPEE
jgi:hypothetical protein